MSTHTLPSAAGTATSPNVVFYNVANSGASAVAPILEELLFEHLGYENLGDPQHSAAFADEFEGRDRVYHWTHSPVALFEDYIGRADFRFLCLVRDPRDVLVSHVKDVIHLGGLPDDQENGLYRSHLASDCAGMFHTADEWLQLDRDNVFVFTFEELKRDVFAMVGRILEFIGVRVDEATIRASCEKHSFENVTRRKRGESGEVIRNKFIYRKGISGDWRSRFEPDVVAEFESRLGDLLDRWGYRDTAPGQTPSHVPIGARSRVQGRTTEFQIVSAPFPSGATWLVNVLLELGVRTTHTAGAYPAAHWMRTSERVDEIAPAPLDHLRSHLPVLREQTEFAFVQGVEVFWEHRLDDLRHAARPTVLFVRDGRDAVYSMFRRHYAADLSFEEYLRRADHFPAHFPGLFGLPPAETWALFNIAWLRASATRRIHVVRFEDTKVDPVGEASKVLHFLGVDRPREEIVRAVERSSFARAKAAEQELGREATRPANNRRGQPEEWRETFADEDLAVFRGLGDFGLRSFGYEASTAPVAPLPAPASVHVDSVRAMAEARLRGLDLAGAMALLLDGAQQFSTRRDVFELLADRLSIEWTAGVFHGAFVRLGPAECFRGTMRELLGRFHDQPTIRRRLAQALAEAGP